MNDPTQRLASFQEWLKVFKQEMQLFQREDLAFWKTQLAGANNRADRELLTDLVNRREAYVADSEAHIREVLEKIEAGKPI